MVKLFNRNKKNARKEHLQKIHTMLNDITKSGNDVKIWHSKHNILVSVCIELMVDLPLDERKLVQAIIEKCRY